MNRMWLAIKMNGPLFFHYIASYMVNLIHILAHVPMVRIPNPIWYCTSGAKIIL